MAGAFDSIADILMDLGTGAGKIIENESALYGLYLIGIFGGLFAFINFLLKRGKFFQSNGGNKAAGFLSFTISIITTGFIFTKFNSPSELNSALGGFFGYIFLSAIALVNAVFAVKFYLNKKKNGDDEVLVFSKLYASASVFMAASLLSVPFSEASRDKGFTFFNILGADPSTHMFTILNIIATITAILSIIYVFKFLVVLFSGKDAMSKKGIHDLFTGGSVENKAKQKKISALVRDLEKSLKDGDEIINHMKNLKGA